EADLARVLAVARRAAELGELLGVEGLEEGAHARHDDRRHVLRLLLVGHLRPRNGALLRLLRAARRLATLLLGRRRGPAARAEENEHPCRAASHGLLDTTRAVAAARRELRSSPSRRSMALALHLRRPLDA